MDDKHIFNYFYNRVVNQSNQIPIWNWDGNMIGKTLNPKAVNFKGSKILDRLRGDNFSVRLIQDFSSQFQIILKEMTTTTELY